jgi:hypothetical protein
MSDISLLLNLCIITLVEKSLALGQPLPKDGHEDGQFAFLTIIFKGKSNKIL